MIFIYEILKIILFTRFFKKSQFFEKKNIANFKQSFDCSKVNNNFFEYKKCTIDYLYLSSCMSPTLLTISNLFINNIENIFKGKIIF